MYEKVYRGKIRGKILIIDDSLRFLSLLSRFLLKKGYEVVTEEDPEKAIKIYKTEYLKKKPFDIVILDLNLPYMNGDEVFQRIKRFDKDLKAIISSGYPDNPIISKYEEYGFLRVLNKPYKMETLNDTLIEILNNHKNNQIVDKFNF